MLQSFAGLNQQLRDKILRMANLKSKALMGDKDTLKNLEVLQKECLMLFTFLRNLSRRMRSQREEQKKQIGQMQGRLEKTTLKVKNSAYETAMLKKAIHLEADFESAHNDVDIISVEEFKKNAPAHFKKWSDDHDLTIKRLTFELQERQRLQKECKVVKEQLTQVSSKNATQEDTLKSIQDKAAKAHENVISMTEDLAIPQSILGPDERCSELPKQLYNIYHGCYYQKLMSFEMDNNTELLLEGDGEEGEIDDGQPPKKRRKLDESDIHPLSVTLRFKDLNADIQLRYSKSNRLILATLRIDCDGTGDYKKQHHRAMEKLFSGHKPIQIIAGGEPTTTFSWVQELGGVPAPSTAGDTPQVNLRTLKAALTARLESIKSLKGQFASMTKFGFDKTVDECIPDIIAASVFKKFTAAEAESRFKSLPFGGDDLGPSLVYFYQAHFTAQPIGKEQVILQAILGVPPDYPENKPIIRCKLLMGTSAFATLTSKTLQAMRSDLGVGKDLFEGARDTSKDKLGRINIAKFLQIIINNDFGYMESNQSALAVWRVSLMVKRLFALFDKLIQRIP